MTHSLQNSFLAKTNAGHVGYYTEKITS